MGSPGLMPPVPPDGAPGRYCRAAKAARLEAAVLMVPSLPPLQPPLAVARLAGLPAASCAWPWPASRSAALSPTDADGLREVRSLLAAGEPASSPSGTTASATCAAAAAGTSTALGLAGGRKAAGQAKGEGMGMGRAAAAAAGAACIRAGAPPATW